MEESSILSEPDYTGHRRRMKDKYRSSGLDTWLDYEVLEFILTFSVPRRDTKPIAKKLIQRYQRLGRVFEVSIPELQALGLTEQSAILLHLMRDLAIRYTREALIDGDGLSSPQLVVQYLTAELKGRSNEAFMVIYLNNQNRVIHSADRNGIRILQEGTINQSVVFPRRIVEEALKLHAASIILAHNHPAGSLSPSPEDLKVTHTIRQALQTVEIRLLDHIIIGGSHYYSFRENGIEL
ncbi:MAG: DNA repair protein RadC [Candidatus Delongbacteria bacterium]|nr:DNA repair protein RadC [Candidatus Delongbacteria bacterium]